MTDKKAEKKGGVKVYERPKTPPSKIKAISIVAALVLLIAIAFVAFYVLM